MQNKTIKYLSSAYKRFLEHKPQAKEVEMKIYTLGPKADPLKTTKTASTGR